MRPTIYALAALPLTVLGGIASIAGTAGSVSRWERRLVERLRLAQSCERPPVERSVRQHLLATLPASVAAFVLAFAVTLLLVMNLGYPLRPEFELHDITHLFSSSTNVGDSWGGPTMAGAWAFHAVVATGIALAGAVPIRWLVAGRVESAMGLIGVEAESAQCG